MYAIFKMTQLDVMEKSSYQKPDLVPKINQHEDLAHMEQLDNE